jgi:hypothetical protein
VQIHFDGDIAVNHQVSMRTLAKSLTHLQASMDRAFLEIHYGSLWKFAKMRQEFHSEVELLVQEPREGGYVLDFLSDNPVTRAVIDRVKTAVSGAVEDSKKAGQEKARKIEDGLGQKIELLNTGVITPKNLEEVINDPAVVRKYGDRAITREIDQILSIIRAKPAGDSTFELLLSGEKSAKFSFDKPQAELFHSTVAKRSIGDPIIYQVTVSSLDRHNKSGKIFNLVSEKVANLYFLTEEHLEEALPFFNEKGTMTFIGCPLIEYGAFDPNAGDIYFAGLV